MGKLTEKTSDKLSARERKKKEFEKGVRVAHSIFSAEDMRTRDTGKWEHLAGRLAAKLTHPDTVSVIVPRFNVVLEKAKNGDELAHIALKLLYVSLGKYPLQMPAELNSYIIKERTQPSVKKQPKIKTEKECQRRSKNLPEGGVKVGHCGGQHKAVTGGVKVVQFVG